MDTDLVARILLFNSATNPMARGVSSAAFDGASIARRNSSRSRSTITSARRVIVTRNARGKVTLGFPQGLKGVDKNEVLAAVEQVVKDLG
jgi:hypothetical protein